MIAAQLILRSFFLTHPKPPFTIGLLNSKALRAYIFCLPEEFFLYVHNGTNQF